ncbi:GntR family transcriptional regulator [Actinoplanes sp. NPDC089786]|uniref:GntR family transcriptional regulator n=1 Tax=Actinoplanes sp. NPDC089786 TaxID=3155185 RepID=UPI00341C729B
MAVRDGERREPKYATIAADLQSRIAIGEFRPGQALPPQRELSASYGVTLMTLRQALGLLTDQGLVSQEPGRGTFVSGPKAAHTMGPLRSLSDDLRAQGHTVDTIVLARQEGPLPEWVAEQLGLPTERGEIAGPSAGRGDIAGPPTGRGDIAGVPAGRGDGDPVHARRGDIAGSEPAQGGASGLRIERLRRLGATPAIHQTSWLPERVARLLAGADLTVTSLYDALTSAGMAPVRAEERLAPALLEESLSALLNRPAGTPVLHSDRITYAGGDTPIVFDRATILGDLIEVRAVHTAGASSSSYPSLR